MSDFWRGAYFGLFCGVAAIVFGICVAIVTKGVQP